MFCFGCLQLFDITNKASCAQTFIFFTSVYLEYIPISGIVSQRVNVHAASLGIITKWPSAELYHSFVPTTNV